MKKFRFPLKPVATLRAHREQLAREAFAAAVQAGVRAEGVLAQARARVVQFEAAVATGRQGSFSAMNQVHALTAYRAELEVEKQAEKALQAAHIFTNQKRLEYVEAHRRVEVISRLEEKAREEHRLEALREEQANYDDFAGRSFSAKARAASVA